MKQIKKYIRYIGKNWAFYLILGLAIIDFIIMLLRLGVNQDIKWLWRNEIISALLGAAIVAAITWLLLKGQAKNQSRVDQEKKVFENRLNAYESFLKILNDVVVRNVVAPEDEKRLQFSIAEIGIHATSREMFLLSKNIKRIVRKIKVNNPADSSIWQEVIDIVSLFQNSLYGERTLDNDDVCMKKALLNFSGLCSGDHNEVLEYVECMISDFKFDSFIVDRCLFVSIPISLHVQRKLKHIKGFVDNVPKRLYVTLQLDEKINERYRGQLVIYCGKKPKEQELIDIIYDKYWQFPQKPRWDKKNFYRNTEIVKLSVNYIEHAYLYDIKDMSRENIRSIMTSLFIYLNKVWALEREQFVMVMAMEEDKEGKIIEKRAKIDVGYGAADSSKFKKSKKYER